jgi:hypothetical protein
VDDTSRYQSQTFLTASFEFSQSVVLYTTSYFGAATEDLQMLRAAAVDLLLGRSWIRHDLLAYFSDGAKLLHFLTQD